MLGWRQNGTTSPGFSGHVQTYLERDLQATASPAPLSAFEQFQRAPDRFGVGLVFGPRHLLGLQ